MIDARAARWTRDDRGFHRWEDAAESRRFTEAFSKVLVEAILRGDGDLGVYAQGQVLWYSRRAK
jgi:hypothetical protein